MMEVEGAGSFWTAMRTTNCASNWYWKHRDSLNQWLVPLTFSNWDLSKLMA